MLTDLEVFAIRAEPLAPALRALCYPELEQLERRNVGHADCDGLDRARGPIDVQAAAKEAA